LLDYILFRLKISFCHIKNAFCWTKLHFVGLNCILSDKVKNQTFSA
jgi:hypothetical protein